MIQAIVTSIDEKNLLASPMEEADLNALIGKKARYVDNEGKVWPAKVVGKESDTAVIVKFDEMPTGLGQGQILEILDKPEDEAEAGNPEYTGA
ncbi:MAG: hypothetical protein QW774_02255 [Candidatus Micrarchaeaceae archaeon]